MKKTLIVLLAILPMVALGQLTHTTATVVTSIDSANFAKVPQVTPKMDSTRVNALRGQDTTRAVVREGVIDTKVTNLKIYNVLDYGAVMDGVTDDASACSTAVARAGVAGGRVLIPSGTMLVDFDAHSTFTVNSNVTIEGSGGSIIKTPVTDATAARVLFTVASGATNVAFRNLTIIGPDTSAYTTTGVGLASDTAGARVLFDNCHIKRFTNGIKSYGGNQTLTVIKSEIDSCAQGILQTVYGAAYVGGSLIVSDSYFHNTWPSSAGLSHLIYTYSENNLQSSNNTFAYTNGYGIQFAENDTPGVVTAGTHLINNCVFDSCGDGSGGGGINTDSKPTQTVQISNCRFNGGTNGIRWYNGNVQIDNCEFRTYGKGIDNAGKPREGTIVNSRFYVLGTHGVYISSTTDSLQLRMSENYFDIQGTALGIYFKDSLGLLDLSHNKFEGASGATGLYTQAGTLHVNENTFKSIGTGIYIGTNVGTPVALDLSRNIFDAVVNVAYYPETNSHFTLTGSENEFKSGVEIRLYSDAGLNTEMYLGNRSARSANIGSDSVITLSRNYNLFPITGTTDIDSIQISGLYATNQVGQFGLCHIYLLMASTAKFTSTKNIIPANTNARTANQVIHFIYDTTNKKWLEVY